MVKSVEPSEQDRSDSKLLVPPSFISNISQSFKARELTFCMQTAYTLFKKSVLRGFFEFGLEAEI